jgi:hypothetical protein
MPLSEHEQKILTDLETSLLQHDPRFAEKVGNIGRFAHRRKMKWLSIAGFIVGLAILVAFFTQSIPVGLVGLAIMLASSIAFTSYIAVTRRT